MYGQGNSDSKKRKIPKSSKKRRIWSILRFMSILVGLRG
jgi:hypothetical protein